MNNGYNPQEIKDLGILIDTGLWLGYFNHDDRISKRSTEIIQEIQKGVYGTAWTTTFIIDELYTLLERMTKRQRIAIDAIEVIMGQKKDLKQFIMIYEITQQDCLEAIELAKKYQDKRMSFTDLTSIVTCSKLALDFIASYDSHFTGILAKID